MRLWDFQNAALVQAEDEQTRLAKRVEECEEDLSRGNFYDDWASWLQTDFMLSEETDYMMSEVEPDG